MPGSLTAQYWLGALGLTAKERGHFEIVRLSFVDDLGRLALLRLYGCLGVMLPARLPRFRQVGRPLLLGFSADITETSGNHGDFHGFLHGFIKDRAENNVCVFVRGFLDNGRSFVNLVQ